MIHSSYISLSFSINQLGWPSFTPVIWCDVFDLQNRRYYKAGMAGVQLHNFNIKYLQLWNAGHGARLTVECRAGKASKDLHALLESLANSKLRAKGLASRVQCIIKSQNT